MFYAGTDTEIPTVRDYSCATTVAMNLMNGLVDAGHCLYIQTAFTKAQN